jgi:transposase InsO family protein
MDDLLVFSRSEAEHLQHLRQVLQRLRDARLFLKPEKCQWMLPEVHFLGHVVSTEGIKVDPKKVSAVADWPAPRDLHQLRSFLGLTNYFRTFILGYASLVRPLTALTSKGVKYVWSNECAAAFEAVKKALCSAPVLRLPDMNKPFELITDASDFCVGACLMQEGHPVAYESRKLIPAERNYHAGEKELLALIHALKVWRCYLEGTPFTAVTDHNPNTTFETKTTLSPRQARWAEFLARFNFTWKYIQGRKNVADPLSRRPDEHKGVLAALTRRRAAAATEPPAASPPRGERDGTRTAPGTDPPRGDPPPQEKRRRHRQRQRAPGGDATPEETTAPAERPRRTGAGVNRWREVQPGEEPAERAEAPPAEAQRKRKRRAPEAPAREAPPPRAVDETGPTIAEQIRAAYAADPTFADVAEKWGLKLDEATELWRKGAAVAVPRDAALRERILHEVHAGPMAGHVGGRKSADALARSFWWEGCKEQMRKYAVACGECLRNKPLLRRPAGPLQPLQVPPKPWHSVTTDMIVKLPRTKRGFDSIAVFVDRLTKMVHFVATTETVDTEGYARLLLNEVVRHHGHPAEIISDRGPQFASILWKELCRLTGCKAKLGSAYHPQTDGQSERTNRVLEEMLRAYVGPLQDDWDQYLPLAEFAINDAWQESVQATPFFLNYGRHPTKPVAVDLPTASAASPTAEQMAREIKEGLERAKMLLNAAQQRQKAWADARRSERSFGVGEEVLLSTKNLRLKTPGTQKLMPLYVGPFKVTERIGAVAYKLELPEAVLQRRVHPVFHVSLLRPYPIDAGRQRPEKPMPLLLDEEGGWYEIDALLDTRLVRGRRQYLVTYRGHDASHNEWRFERDVTETAVREYWASRPPTNGG